MARGEGRISAFSSILNGVGFGLDPIAAMTRLQAAHGSLAELTFGWPGSGFGSRYVFAVGPRYNKRVLSDPVTFQTSGVLLKGPKGSAQRRIRNGLITVNGPHHAHYRRLMLPPLRRASVDALAERMGHVVDRESADWPIAKRVDLFPLVQDVALHVALETLFPTADGCPHTEALNAAALMNAHFRMDGALEVKACPLDAAGTPYRRMLQHAEEVEQALADWARKGGAEIRPDNLLSILANAPDENGAPPSVGLISGHVLTLFGASYETSQAGLAWALYLVAQHPDVAARLLDELQALPDADAVQSCVYLDWVVKESLRLMPPVPVQIRRAACDTDLAGHHLPRGSYVVLSPYLTNRDPALYAEPAKFRPERWASLDPNQYEYLVFSAGPRLCIGGWFATTFLRMALSHIVRRYRIQIAPNSRIDQRTGITMTPARGLPAFIHPQDGRFAAAQVSGNVPRMLGA